MCMCARESREKKKDVDTHKSHETVCVSNKKKDATEGEKEESDCVCMCV